MVLNKLPFQSYRTEEERSKEKSRVMTLRVNKKDQELIRRFQKLFDVQSEGTVLKICLYQYHHVLHQGLSPRYLDYLFKKNRDRLSNYVDLDKLDSEKM